MPLEERKKYKLVFDDEIFRRLETFYSDANLKQLLLKMFNKMEHLGPRAGAILDPKLFFYEVKIKRPPLRIYYKHIVETNNLYLLEIELKTSEVKQRKTIHKLRQKVRDLFKT